ncbi:MAG: BspA family leucine-rich repeat surface protein [Bacteroidaceae bacterium]|nr:BspA family leucine-rich repeat surface protein [Bacteroidaceae bacterium]
MKRFLILFLFALAGMLYSVAQEAYVVYSKSKQTLTFYYDANQSSRTGTKYALNTGNGVPGWHNNDELVHGVVRAVFDASFVDARPTTTSDWFSRMDQLTAIEGLEYLNTSEVTTMDNMFDGCKRLQSVDLTGFNTEKVTKMRYMFRECLSLRRLDLSSFDTRNVTTMIGMFKGAEDKYTWTSHLTTIYATVGKWKVPNDNASASENMFLYCYDLKGGQGTKYDETKVNYTMGYIDGENSQGRVRNGYLTSVDSLKEEPYAVLYNRIMTFYYDKKIYHRHGLSLEMEPGTVTQKYVNMYTAEEAPVKAVVDPSFQNGLLKTIGGMFAGLDSLRTIEGLENLNMSEVTDMSGLFSGCSSLTRLNLSNLDTRNVTDMHRAFANCENLTSLDLSSFNARNVTNMSGLFAGCSSLTSLDLSNFDTRNVKDMSGMFSGCSSLAFDLSSFDTRNVENMSAMFSSCKFLKAKTLDLSSFNTQKVTDMSSMFSSNGYLKTIYVGAGWSTESVTNSKDMFFGCESLVGGTGLKYNSKYVDAQRANIDNPRACYLTEMKEYGLKICGTQVTSKNLTDVLHDGAFSYDPEQNVLSIKGDCQHDSEALVQINSIEREGITLKVEKDVTFTSGFIAIFAGFGAKITGPGTLNIVSQNVGIGTMGSTLTLEEARVNVKALRPMVGTNDTKTLLVIKNSNVHAESTLSDGGAITTFMHGIVLEDCKIITPEGGKTGIQVSDADGNVAKEVVIEPINPADVNQDGTVDSADIVAVIKEMPDGDKKADVNGDTVIDSADIVAVIKAMK